jgi:hypothetical protein
MEKQIREIIAQHIGGTYEAKQKAAKEILLLFSVSGSVADTIGRSCPFCGEPCPECSHKAIDTNGRG